MAGIAFPISHNMMVDVGYRYLNIGDVSTGGDVHRRDDVQERRRARSARRLALELR